MKSAVTISLVPETKGGPFVFSDGLAEGCAAAASLGFDAVEVFPPGAEAVDRAVLRGLLDRHGLKLAAMGTGAGWVARGLNLTLPDPVRREQARDFIRGIIGLAGEFGGSAIIGSMQGRWGGEVSRDLALGWLQESLGELGAFAAKWGVPLLYEPLNRYETNLLHHLGETARWLQAGGVGNVRLLADLFHMNIEEADLGQAIREAGTYLGHVHFADSNRRAMGFGHTQTAPAIQALRQIGYAGYLSAEVLPWPDFLAAARQTIKAIRQATQSP